MSQKPNTPVEEEIFDPQEMFVTLELDDGSEMECQIACIYEAPNKQDYIALCPVEDQDQLIFYRYFEDENGVPRLENIPSDEEFELATDCYDQILDAEEFEAME